MISFMERLTQQKASGTFNQSTGSSFFRRVSRNFLGRIIILTIFVAIPIIFTNALSIFVIDRFTGVFGTVLDVLRNALSIILICLSYRLYCKLLENREAGELSAGFSAMEFFVGAFIGAFLIAVMVGILSLTGMYKIASIAQWGIIISAVLVFFTGAFYQEVIFRLVLFKTLEENLGTWITIALVSLIFSAAHLFNANVTIGSAISMVLSDVLLCGAFVLTRRIWLVWGIHATWNFMQDGIFGLPNSGVDSLPSWIAPSVSGSVFLTGGSYGLEASVPSLVLNLMLGALFLLVAVKYGQIVLPRWKRT